jgi:hypothetical protein
LFNSLNMAQSTELSSTSPDGGEGKPCPWWRGEALSMVERGNPVYGGEGKPCPWWIDSLKYEKCHGFAQKFNMATTAGHHLA